jgi:RNA polymerase sigma-70 factor (ECF subfamily)
VGPRTDVAAALEAAHRDGGAVLATLVRRCHGDLDLAEDALQDAYLAAASDWSTNGVPRQPAAWLRTAAWRKALDRLRRDGVGRTKAARLATLDGVEPAAPESPSAIRDDQLTLVFCCCHPALDTEAQVALTLRTVGGLTTTQIARAFLVPEATMAQRILRAKKKVSLAGIPFRVPDPDQLDSRLAAVLGVLYLVFTAGHHPGEGDVVVQAPLCDEAIRLTRLLDDLLPEEPEVEGLLALMLLHDARRGARVDADGHLVRLADQDRSRWAHDQILEGTRLATRALRRGRPASYQLQAAIAAVHASAPTAADTDWDRIASLYALLAQRAPSPVVELNRCVALTMSAGPEAGLAALDALVAREPGLDRSHLTHSTRAEVLRRLGRSDEAADAYRRALDLAVNAVERAFLLDQVDEVDGLDGVDGRDRRASDD